MLGLHPEVKEMIMSAKQGHIIESSIRSISPKKYSKRLYYLLKDKETFNGGVFVISFDELRKMMKIPESYANRNVKREILDKPYEEINGNTDISFEYELISEKLPSGQHGISAVRFKSKAGQKRNSTIVEYETIEENGETVSTTEDEQEIIDLFDCSIKEARDILRTAKANDRTHEQLIEILSYTLKKQVENKVGYALTILKNGYNEPTKLGAGRTVLHGTTKIWIQRTPR